MPDIMSTLLLHYALYGKYPKIGGGGSVTPDDPSIIHDSPFVNVKLVSKKRLDLNRIVRSLHIENEKLYVRSVDKPFRKVHPVLQFQAMDLRDPFSANDLITHTVDMSSLETNEVNVSAVDSTVLKKSIAVIGNHHFYITARPVGENNISNLRIHKDTVDNGRQVSVSQDLEWTFASVSFSSTTEAFETIRTSIFRDKILISYGRLSPKNTNVHVFSLDLQKVSTGANSNFIGMHTLYSDSEFTVFGAAGSGGSINGPRRVCFNTGSLGNGSNVQNHVSYFDQPRDFVGVNEEKNLALYHTDIDGHSKLIGMKREFTTRIPNTSQSSNPFYYFRGPLQTTSMYYEFEGRENALLDNEFIGKTHDTRGYLPRHQSIPREHRNRHITSFEHGTNKLYSIGDIVIGVVDVLDRSQYLDDPKRDRDDHYIYRRPMAVLKNGFLLEIIDKKKLGITDANELKFGNIRSTICGPHVVNASGDLYFYNETDQTLYKFKISAKEIQ